MAPMKGCTSLRQAPREGSGARGRPREASPRAFPRSRSTRTTAAIGAARARRGLLREPLRAQAGRGARVLSRCRGALVEALVDALRLVDDPIRRRVRVDGFAETAIVQREREARQEG